MQSHHYRGQDIGLTDRDLDFVLGEVAPEARAPERLKQLIRDEENFREAMLGDERVFQRITQDDEVFLKITPSLYFEVLLRRASKELQSSTHTLEQAGKQSIPVFDTEEVVELLSRPEVLAYLSQMLASFTRIHSHVASVRVRRGIRRRVRYNDMDIDSLICQLDTTDEEQRFTLYKRIADVCLFISGVYPSYTYLDYRYPASGQLRPMPVGRLRRNLEDYETEGRRFYGLAERHPIAQAMRLSTVFGLLRERFNSARKPLGFIAANYLR
ncbi:MAG: hypothetical protein HYX93_02095 [Chloroflexi bacterium]|nr:hypothetical protein [Chloroflexota bacterium]